MKKTEVSEDHNSMNINLEMGHLLLNLMDHGHLIILWVGYSNSCGYMGLVYTRFHVQRWVPTTRWLDYEKEIFIRTNWCLVKETHQGFPGDGPNLF